MPRRRAGAALAAGLSLTVALTALGTSAALAARRASGPDAVAAPPVQPASDFPPNDAGFHTYAEMVAEIQATAAAHPDIVEVFSIGKTYQGRDIWAAKVSDNVAVDEPEPEVLFDGLHHAREHLSLEQTLAILRWLATGYGTDPRITNIVDSTEIWIVFAVNPDGAEYDLTGSPYRNWRKNRQPNAGTSAIGTDLNRNYGYRWACCGGSSRSPSSDTYHGPGAFSAPETRAMRDFIASRRVDGIQQITMAITFHTAGEQVLWPYGYTRTAVPSDMTGDDHAALASIGKAMAARNGYTPMQSSHLYVTDGDEIDWAYGTQRIFMYTLEMYPSAAKVGSLARFYPHADVITRETERNKDAILYLIERAGCRYATIGKARQDCGPFYDDFEILRGWQVNPLGTDTARSGAWQRGKPATTSYQLGTAVSGSRVLVTGAAAGATVSANDLDGLTTIRSRAIDLPATTGDLTFSYWFSHSASSSSADWFRVYVETADGTRTLVYQELGAPRIDKPAWRAVSRSMAPWAGQTIRLVFAAADLGMGSTVEAAVDDVRITRP